MAKMTQDEITAKARAEDLAIQASWTRVGRARRTPLYENIARLRQHEGRGGR